MHFDPQPFTDSYRLLFLVCNTIWNSHKLNEFRHGDKLFGKSEGHDILLICFI